MYVSTKKMINGMVNSDRHADISLDNVLNTPNVNVKLIMMTFYERK